MVRGFVILGLFFCFLDTARAQALPMTEGFRQTKTTMYDTANPALLCSGHSEKSSRWSEAKVPKRIDSRSAQASEELRQLFADRMRLQRDRARALVAESSEHSSEICPWRMTCQCQLSCPKTICNRLIKRLRGWKHTSKPFVRKRFVKTVSNGKPFLHVWPGRGPCFGGYHGPTCTWAWLARASCILRGPSGGGSMRLPVCVHQIDQPVGQVKIGIHVLQLRGSGRCSHRRRAQRHRPASRSRSLHEPGIVSSCFAPRFSMVANQIHARSPNRFAESFFYEPCLRNFLCHAWC